jgi:hypothetical protein
VELAAQHSTAQTGKRGVRRRGKKRAVEEGDRRRGRRLGQWQLYKAGTGRREADAHDR